MGFGCRLGCLSELDRVDDLLGKLRKVGAVAYLDCPKTWLGDQSPSCEPGFSLPSIILIVVRQLLCLLSCIADFVDSEGRSFSSLSVPVSSSSRNLSSPDCCE
jgi:hypothetical protein